MNWTEVFSQYKDGNNLISRTSAKVIVQDLGDRRVNIDPLASFAVDGFSSPMTLEQFTSFVKAHNIRIDVTASPTFGKNLIETIHRSKIRTHDKLALSLAFSIEADIAVSKAAVHNDADYAPDDIPFV